MILFLRPQQRINHRYHLVTDMSLQSCLAIRFVVVVCEVTLELFNIWVSQLLKFLRLVRPHNIKAHPCLVIGVVAIHNSGWRRSRCLKTLLACQPLIRCGCVCVCGRARLRGWEIQHALVSYIVQHGCKTCTVGVIGAMWNRCGLWM